MDLIVKVGAHLQAMQFVDVGCDVDRREDQDMAHAWAQLRGFDAKLDGAGGGAAADVDVFDDEFDIARDGRKPALAGVGDWRFNIGRQAAFERMRRDLRPAHHQINIGRRVGPARQKIGQVAGGCDFGADHIFKAHRGQRVPAFGDAARFGNDGLLQVAGLDLDAVRDGDWHDVDGAMNQLGWGDLRFQLVQMAGALQIEKMAVGMDDFGRRFKFAGDAAMHSKGGARGDGDVFGVKQQAAAVGIALQKRGVLFAFGDQLIAQHGV